MRSNSSTKRSSSRRIGPVDLLLISWNRSGYLSKTLDQLLSSNSDFRLHCWDNGSTDGAAEMIASLSDERIVVKHFNETNVGQTEPSLWFLKHATGDIGGKIDDDILLPHGWIERIEPIVRNCEGVGMIGCWIFMPEDWDPTLAAKSVIALSGERIFRMTSIAGQSFLCRMDLLRRYADPASLGFPVDSSRIAADGYINGHPVDPLLCGHNMDDPRSPHSLIRDGNEAQWPLTMRRLGFKKTSEYADWIAEDARRRQAVPFDRQLRVLKWRKNESALGRLWWRAAKASGLTKRMLQA